MVYIFHAIRRNKDNTPENHGHMKSREICLGDESRTIARLKANTTAPGIWRIYRSVNRRNVKKAELELLQTLASRLAFPTSVSDAPVTSLWKTILMQPHNKAERKFLIDVDDENALPLVRNIASLEIESIVKTPNGYHIVCLPFDPRLIENIPNVSIQKDGLLLIDVYEVKNGL